MAFCWRRLLAMDVVYKIAAFAVLGPVAGLALNLALSISGQEVLADQEILAFALTPAGLASMILLIAIGVSIAALQSACFVTLGLAAHGREDVAVLDVLKWTLGRWRPVLAFAVRLVLRVVAMLLPLLAVVGVLYGVLLRDHDINFYLAQTPPEWWLTLGIAGVAAALTLALGVPRLLSWALALPLVLFDGVEPGEAFGRSRDLTAGERPLLAAALVGWALGSLALSSAALAVPGWIGAALGSALGASPQLLLLGLGGVVLVWLIGNLAVSLIAGASFGLLVARIYRRSGGHAEEGPVRSTLDSGGSFVMLTRRRLVAGLLVALVVAGAIGFLLERQVSTRRTVAVIAHRGAAGAAPENTMAAVERALLDGADWVEIDVQESADGEVVVMHDSDFMKVASDPLKIWDATAADLARIDIGSWFDPDFAAERVPRLSEVLERCRGRAGVNIELKYYGHDELLEQRVVDIVEASGMQDDIVLMSLKAEAVAKLKALRPEWTVGLLAATALGDLTRAEADFLAVNTGMASRSFVRSAQSRERPVYVWTVNDAATMALMVARGVDGIITDEPALAREVLSWSRELSSLERLLVVLALFTGATADSAGLAAEQDGGGVRLEELGDDG
jgi:glycerophosphoryl diester phosphodiesterase